MPQHEVTTTLTTDQMESADDAEIRLEPPSGTSVNVGDDLILTSADGDHFLGFIYDIDDLGVYVQLT